MNVKGKAGLDSSMPVGECHFVEQQQVNPCQQSSDQQAECMHVVICPKCQQESPADKYTFQNSDLDLKMRCFSCKSNGPLKLWKCCHNVVWHTCMQHKLHRTASSQKRAAKQPHRHMPKISRPGAATRELLLNSTFEQILDDDLRRESKKAKLKDHADDYVIVLNPAAHSGKLKASWLPPVLRERFAATLAAR